MKLSAKIKKRTAALSVDGPQMLKPDYAGIYTPNWGMRASINSKALEIIIKRISFFRPLAALALKPVGDPEQ
jgi:hypothetical protein